MTGLGNRTPARGIRRGTGLVLLALGLVMPCGCDRGGVGSVDWEDNPKARPVGEPPHLPQKPSKPSRVSPKKTPEFHPG